MSSPCRYAAAIIARPIAAGDEAAWWKEAGVDPTVTARALWLETHPLPTTADQMGSEGATSLATLPTTSRKPSVIS